MKEVYEKNFFSNFNQNNIYSVHSIGATKSNKPHRDPYTKNDYFLNKSINSPTKNNVSSEYNNPYYTGPSPIPDPPNYENTDNYNDDYYLDSTDNICENTSPYKLSIYKYGQDFIEIESGESSGFKLSEYSCDTRVDLQVHSSNEIVIWGEVRDNYCKSVANVIVTLMKVIVINGHCDYCKVSTTLTDKYGYYNFIIPNSKNHCAYEVTITQLPNTC